MERPSGLDLPAVEYSTAAIPTIQAGSGIGNEAPAINSWPALVAGAGARDIPRSVVGRFGIAKLGIGHAEPLTFLVLRYAIVLIVLAPLAMALGPAWPRTLAQWFHLAMIGFLIQAVYFGLCYLAFHAKASSGTVAIIVCLQPILVGLTAP